MFGIGFGELVIVMLVVLIAVGPDRLPQLMRTVGKGLRTLRKATNELRAQTGVDELLRDHDPLGVRDLEASLRADLERAPESRAPVDHAEIEHELPAIGVDFDYVRASFASSDDSDSEGAADSPAASSESAGATDDGDGDSTASDEQAAGAGKAVG